MFVTKGKCRVACGLALGAGFPCRGLGLVPSAVALRCGSLSTRVFPFTPCVDIWGCRRCCCCSAVLPGADLRSAAGFRRLGLWSGVSSVLRSFKVSCKVSRRCLCRVLIFGRRLAFDGSAFGPGCLWRWRSFKGSSALFVCRVRAFGRGWLGGSASGPGCRRRWRSFKGSSALFVCRVLAFGRGWLGGSASGPGCRRRWRSFKGSSALFVCRVLAFGRGWLGGSASGPGCRRCCGPSRYPARYRGAVSAGC